MEVMEILPKEPPELIKQDHWLVYAWDIATGKTGTSYLYSLEEDIFYAYEKGVWIGLYDVEFMSKVCNNFKKITMYPLHNRKQIIENFKTIKYKKIKDFNWTELLNLENGMINPYDGILQEHEDIFYSTMRLEYKFNENEKCELWIKTLNEIFENNQSKINLLQEFFGYCLTRDTKQHKALLLLGESRSGKSTILQTLRGVIGEKNCSSVPLKFISNPQYTPMLINKLVNIDTDVSARAVEFEAEFKTITSGEPVSCNQKFIATFEFTPFCKIVMAANIFPRITDHSSAFYKRLILIPCDRVFSDEEQNRNLQMELKKELSGILNWSMEGLKKLNNRGRFEECEFMREAIEDLEDTNNPTNIFFGEFITLKMGDYIEKGELYNKYKIWAESNKHYCLSSAMFANALYKNFSKSTPKKSHLPNGKRIWRNIGYLNQIPSGENISWQE